MSEQFIPHPPSPKEPKSNSLKQVWIIIFLISAVALLIGVLIAPSDESPTSDTTPAAPVVTDPPAPAAPPVNKYDSYLAHVYNNSGQANSMTKAKLIEYGDIICNALDSGRSVAWIADYLSQNSSGSSDIELYASIMYGAITNICPEYEYDLKVYLNS